MDLFPQFRRRKQYLRDSFYTFPLFYYAKRTNGYFFLCLAFAPPSSLTKKNLHPYAVPCNTPSPPKPLHHSSRVGPPSFKIV